MDSPRPSIKRYHSLDLWRGIACLCIVIFHSLLVWLLSAQKSDSIVSKLLKLCSNLELGVPIFFVISGYCISAAAHSAQETQMPARWYFWRRLRRIYPPYWAAILLQIFVLFIIDYWLFSGLLTTSVKSIARPWTFEFWPWIGNLTLVESWRSYIIGPTTAFILGQSWTLCYEEQFYFIIGLLLLLFPKNPRAAFISINILLLITLLLPKSYALNGLFIDGRLLIFALGIYLYALIHFGNRYWLLLFFTLIILAWIFPPIPLNYGIKAAILFTVTTYLLYPFDLKISSLNILNPLRFCGKICYSLYLTHPPFVRSISQYFYSHGYVSEYFTLFVVVPLSLCISILVAWIFYLLVECRFLNSSAAS